jgi:thermosome
MGDVTVTNDGVTILQELDIDNPTASMIVEVAETQEDEAGDGTTTAVAIAGELLSRAEDLLEQDIHPTAIITGYNLAADRAREEVDAVSEDVDPEDRDLLRKVAETSMTGKGADVNKELLAELVVDAVDAVTVQADDGSWVVDLDYVKLENQTGRSADESELLEGAVISKDPVHTDMPGEVDDADVLLVDEPIEVEETDVDAELQLDSPDQLQDFLDSEEQQLREKVDTIADSGADVVFCQKGIDDLAQHFLAKRGIYAVRRAKSSDMEKLERVTGASTISSIKDIAADDLGQVGSVEERTIGDDTFTAVEGSDGARSVSILLRGGTEHVIDEIERSIQDAVRVTSVAVEDGKIVPGGGAPETELALRLRDYANKVGGREQLAVEAFAEALEIVPRTLAENAGLDAIQALVDLRAAHESGDKAYGFDVFEGEVANSQEANVLEPLRVKTQALQSATEVADMILRIDDVIAASGFSDDGGDGPDLPDL